MAFSDFPKRQGVQLLQRSLERGRLGHAYLFTGQELSELEALARALAKTLNCIEPTIRNGVAVDCCGKCVNCQKIDHENHADVFWVRPESKMRHIRIRQITRRDDSGGKVLLEFVNMKPTESRYKVGIVSGADCMNDEAANSFLKTLEEPPASAVLVLLSTNPQRLLETILSRCLRLDFGGGGAERLAAAQLEWLSDFTEMASAEQKTLLGRYRLMDVMLQKLTALRTRIEEDLRAKSPLERYADAEKDLVDKWESELTAAVESEYRRQRSELLLALQLWLRDVWVNCALRAHGTAAETQASELLSFPQLPGTVRVAGRITARDALENLQVLDQLHRWLGTNVQEALALEVGLLKLRL